MFKLGFMVLKFLSHSSCHLVLSVFLQNIQNGLLYPCFADVEKEFALGKYLGHKTCFGMGQYWK